MTRNEGSLLAAWTFGQFMKNFTEVGFKYLVNFTNYMFHNIDEERVVDYYLKNVDKTDGNAMRKAFYDFYGDVILKCPTYLFAKQLAEGSPHRNTFFYELTYQTKDMAQVGCDEKTMGICHGAEVEFVFGNFLNEYTKMDIEFSEDVMKMWTNFAKTGFGLLLDLQ